MTEEELSECVTQAELDPHMHKALCRWLSGESGMAVPSALPAALTPFVKRLAANKRPEGRGSKVPLVKPDKIKSCVEALQAEYSCTQKKAFEYIAKALQEETGKLSPKPGTIKRLFRSK
ncbi:hypothetical protein IWQ49_000915 [Labrenzia sp. EL_126]|nr:hypothetical protein [Labrenzia sp. EL_126]